MVSLDAPLGPRRPLKRTREEWMAACTEDRAQRTHRRTEEHAADKERRQRESDAILDRFIASERVVGDGRRVVAEEFNGRARENGVKHGVMSVMENRSFARRRQKVGEKMVWCYLGLSWDG